MWASIVGMEGGCPRCSAAVPAGARFCPACGAAPGGGAAETGDAVNVAARLEHMAESGTILAGERTYAAARDAFVFGEPESRELRGKSAPVTVRRVIRPLTDALDRRKGMQVAMVGREQEVESLASLLHEAIDANSPRLALISGPAGIGKSRLVREFLAERVRAQLEKRVQTPQ